MAIDRKIGAHVGNTVVLCVCCEKRDEWRVAYPLGGYSGLAGHSARYYCTHSTVLYTLYLYTTNSIKSLIFRLKKKNNLKIVCPITPKITKYFGRIYESSTKRAIKRFYSKQLFNVTEIYLNEIHIRLSMVIVLKLNMIFIRSQSIITELSPTVSFLYIYFNAVFRVLTV